MQSEIEEAWNAQEERIAPVKEAGGMSAYLEHLQQDNIDMLSLDDRTVRCIDEGASGHGLHLAGSGILLGEERAYEIMKAANVDMVTSHEGCGAAALYAKEHGLDAAKADEYGQEFSKKLAERLGVPYKHIAAEEMDRPKEFHHARYAIYDGTGTFNHRAIPGFPAAFVVNRRINEGGLAEAEVSASIALGDHGFGQRFTAESPFTFIVIGDPESEEFSADSLVAELEPIAVEQGGVIHIEHYTPALSESAA